MDDILLLQERVKNTIGLGESHFREFKTAWEGKPGNKKPRLTKKICEDIGEALVSFANADGGELLIGVEDDGTIYIRRKDKATMPASVNEINFERQEIRSREYDSLFVDGAFVTDLDIPLLQSVADSYIKGLSVELFLQQTGLAVYGANGLRLKRAALLLFAKTNEIARWHSKCQIRYLKVQGDELKSGEDYNVVSDESIQGNIFDLCFKAWDGLRPYLSYKTEFSTDAHFEQKYTYPEAACREAIINAIAHRDYSIQNGIEIYIFNNKIEIKSPGALLSTITIKNLYELEGAHESRNPLITRILRESKLMRELGEGMKRIFNLMNPAEFERPILYSNGMWFKVTLSKKKDNIV